MIRDALISNDSSALPPAKDLHGDSTVQLIFDSAFNTQAAGGGFVGTTVMLAAH